MTEFALQFRPDLSEIKSQEEFERWYWPVAEMQEFCRVNGLAYSGLKAELRERIACSFNGAKAPKAAQTKRPSLWSKKHLCVETLIDHNITFGSNVRGFFKDQIGSKFVCSSNFMKWVKSNHGRTLGDAVEYWYEMNSNAAKPEFRSEIDQCNNYLQYLRDLRDNNPKVSQTEAKQYWAVKSRLPAKDGYVVYEASDLDLLDDLP